MAKFKLGAIIVGVIVVIILILQNTAPVEIQILFMSISMPRAALVVLILLIGIIAGIFISLAVSARRAKKAESFEQKEAATK